jgi:hypothetical protein
MLDSSGVVAYTLGKSVLVFPRTAQPVRLRRILFKPTVESKASSRVTTASRSLFTSSNMMLPIKPVQLALQFESRDITGIFKSILSDAPPSLLLALDLVSPPPRSRLFWKWALAPAAS